MLSIAALEEQRAIELSDEKEDDEIESDAQIQAELEEISKIVLSGSDWTTATILDQLVRENIQLNPRFQRRDAWDLTRKSRFIESIMLGFPIPQIVLATSNREKGKYIVLDGKQRLLTILQFYGKSTGSKNNSFPLKKLELRPDLNGKNYKLLEDNINFLSDFDSLNNQTIRTVVIRNWHSESILHKMFLRLNQENTPLYPQELRQALHPGTFVNFLDDRSIASPVLQKIFNSKNGDVRMRDAELLLRYIAFHYFLPDYAGNTRTFLDTTCDRLNQQWNDKEEDIKDLVERFDKAVELTIDIFGEKNLARVWEGENQTYRKAFNQATFDVMMFYFSDDIVRESAKDNMQKIEAAFKELCAQPHTEFRESVRGKTSVSSVHARLSLWGQALSEALQLEFRIPELVNNRIVFDGLR
jgi:uncharacterized protein with ParB-like and HNH nuclease domain